MSKTIDAQISVINVLCRHRALHSEILEGVPRAAGLFPAKIVLKIIQREDRITKIIVYVKK